MKVWPILFGVLVSGDLVMGQVGTPEYDPLAEYDDLPKRVRVQVEFVELSHELLTETLSGPEAAVGGKALRDRVGGLVKEGKASILETMVVVARSGQKATVESVQEYIYPTEYEPVSPDVENPGDVLSIPVMYLATAFETRNLGSTLEVEPTIGANDQIVDLRLVPEIVYLVGESEWGTWDTDQGKGRVSMPKIYTLRMSGATTLAAGEAQMLAVLSPKDEKGVMDSSRKLMVFVKTDVLRIGVPLKKQK